MRFLPPRPAYCFIRYPVRNIHAMAATQAMRNRKVMPRLVATSTSAFPYKLQRKPLISYTTGLNSATVRQPGGSMSIE